LLVVSAAKLLATLPGWKAAAWIPRSAYRRCSSRVNRMFSSLLLA